jgi:hypothetical protein
MAIRTASGVDETPRVDTVRSLALVDSALSESAHRSFVTKHEAVETMTRIRDSVTDPARTATVASIANEALLSFESDQLIDHWRLIDPLLDIRRMLAS